MMACQTNPLKIYWLNPSQSPKKHNNDKKIIFSDFIVDKRSFTMHI